jgi:O-antigen ligase
VPSSSRRSKRQASRTDRVGRKPAVAKTSLKLFLAIRAILCALGLSFFPAAFVGSLWLVPAFAAVASVGWFLLEGRRAGPKQLALVAVILAAYFVPSIIPCSTGDGFCPQRLVEQEIYLLAVGLLLYVCGYIAADRTDGIDRYIFGAALGLYIAIAVVVLITRDNLTRDIEPPFIPLLIERNDLALLVAWMFFVCALFRTLVGSRLAGILAFLIVVAVAAVVSLATQSRLVAVISVIGVLFFARIEHRVPSSWWIGLGILVACFLAVEYQSVERLVRRAVLAEGMTSISSRVYLWKSGWDMFLNAPWFGHGLGGFAELFDTYRHAAPVEPGIDVRFTPWPHNVLIEILVEKGIAGLTAFLALLALVLANLKDKPRETFKEVRRAAGFVLLTLIIVGLLDSTTKRIWYLPSLLYVLGMSAGLAQKRDSFSSGDAVNAKALSKS